MEEYKSNSDKARQEEQHERRVNAVTSEKAQLRKKNEVQRFGESIIAQDLRDVGSYVLTEVILPAVKKAIYDITTTGIDRLLYGESTDNRRKSPAAKVSYRTYYERDRESYRPSPAAGRSGTPDYDDILFASRGDAEAVLDAMNDIIAQYGTVSVSDFYDLARIPNDNFTMNRYGWTNISHASAARVRDGYILNLPRAVPLN